MAEFKNIVFSTDAQFHTLVHFEQIDTPYQNFLIDAGYNVENIKEQLGTIRSKFYPQLFNNPVELVPLIEKAKKQEINYDSGKISIQINTDIAIGKDNLVKIDSLKNQDQQKLKKVELNGVELWKIVAEPVPTHQINAILFTESTQNTLVTIFPGTFAPPFPDKNKQSQKEWSMSNEFWTKHAFIENNKTQIKPL